MSRKEVREAEVHSTHHRSLPSNKLYSVITVWLYPRISLYLVWISEEGQRYQNMKIHFSGMFRFFFFAGGGGAKLYQYLPNINGHWTHSQN